MANWGYTKENGPENWLAIAPAGNGRRQSPIDIIPENTEFDKSLLNKPLKWIYTPTKAETLINSGHSAQVTYADEGSLLEGGPLKNEYKIKQFHLHWGKTDKTGSEHRINNEMFAAELHLVHWNSEKYSSFAEAAQRSDGLCVLGVFLKVGKEHTELKKMTDLLSQVHHGGQSVVVPPQGIDPQALLPENTDSYWTYPGSLTTPPLYESVTWVVFKEPIEVSQQQIDEFRSLREHKIGQMLHNEYNGCIVDNYRPPQPLGNRTVRSTCSDKSQMQEYTGSNFINQLFTPIRQYVASLITWMLHNLNL